MAVNLNLPQASAVAGVELVSLSAGLKKNGTPDMVVGRLVEGSTVAAVFTQNTFCAAPVIVAKEHMSASGGAVRALLINSGNANAGTGEPGNVMARAHCAALAKNLSVPTSAVLPFSTGVIGQLLPDERMLAGIDSACALLDAGKTTGVDAWHNAANGIMTTDTHPKLTSQTVDIDGKHITVTGFAKGAGMIQPNMATMLSYVFTDAAIAQADLDAALKKAVDVSFNAITVDSDTSTNDACVLVATGACGASALSPDKAGWSMFFEALVKVCVDLAQGIIRDAEGATKFISVHVAGGRDDGECKQVAYAIANSPLVKTAMFASDANVGRLLMAIGKSGVALEASNVRVSLGDVLAFENAGIAPGYTEERGAAVMAMDEIEVFVDLGQGTSKASVYTSDLSHEYVSINADYRS